MSATTNSVTAISSTSINPITHPVDDDSILLSAIGGGAGGDTGSAVTLFTTYGVVCCASFPSTLKTTLTLTSSYHILLSNNDVLTNPITMLSLSY
jgi:hypothetical protein